MKIKAKCKFKVVALEHIPGGIGEKITLRTEYDLDTSKEDNAFTEWTPFGEMTFHCQNPSLVGTFTLGEDYYIGLTPCKEE